MASVAHQVGLVLLGGLFVWAGVEHFFVFRELAGRMREKRVPAAPLLLAAGSLLQIGAGICVALGFGQPYASLALVVFTIAASVMFLDFWRRQGPERVGLRSAFLVNIGLIGGLIAVGYPS